MNEQVIFLARQRAVATEQMVDKLREENERLREGWLRTWEILREVAPSSLNRIEGARHVIEEGDAEFGKEAP